ncbi:uncharacterized protein [Chiloscyllium punctatum]|uniref:uncharacterized protein n=1 Tax=Chiloscyllium punctatum TaxID=137246 RepID=UPI003B634BAB
MEVFREAFLKVMYLGQGDFNNSRHRTGVPKDRDVGKGSKDGNLTFLCCHHFVHFIRREGAQRSRSTSNLRFERTIQKSNNCKEEAVLEPGGPLEVEIFPEPLEVLANEDALLKCKYKEPESDLSHVAVRWTFTSQTAKKDVYIFNGGKHQPIRNGAKMFDNALQKGNASLYLPNVQRYEEGTYTCVVFVTPHKEEKSSVMQVSVQPKVSMSVQEISTANGTEHFLQCDVKEFYPKPIKVSWFKLSDGKMEYVSTSQSTEDIVTNSDGTFSVSSKIKTEPTWDEQTDYRCLVEHKTIFDNFTLEADSVADKIPAVYQIIGGIVGFILCAICVGLCVGLCIWYKKSKETQEIRTGKDSHKDGAMQVTDRSTQDQLQDEYNQEAEGGNNQEGPSAPEESENCPLIPVQQRVADFKQKTQEIRTGKDSHEDRTMQVTDHLTQDQLQDEHNQEAEGGINQEGSTSPEASENYQKSIRRRAADFELRQSTPVKNEFNTSQGITPFKRKTQEIRTGKDSHEDRTMQVTDHLTQDQLQDEHNQEAKGGINQEGSTSPEASENYQKSIRRRAADFELRQSTPVKNEFNTSQGITPFKRKTQEIRTGKDSHEDRTMQVTDHLTQDQLQDEHNQEAEGGINQEGSTSPEASENYQKPIRQRVADFEQRQSTPKKNENNISQSGTSSRRKTQEIRTGKDSHEGRTMQVTDRSTQDQLQDENNQEAKGGINQEGSPSPEASENYQKPIRQRVADFEQRQSTPEKNENNIGQSGTSSRRKTQEIHTGEVVHDDRTMQVTDHLTQDQLQDEHNQEAEGGINQEETQEIRTGKESHKDGTMEVTDHINQDQLQDENKQEAEGGINPEETQEIRTGKDSHEDRTMQVTDRSTQDQLQDEHNQEAEGGINQEGLTSPEASENYRKPVHQMVADFEQNTKVQSTPEKNEVNTSQGVTHFKRKTQEIRTGKDNHKDGTMEVTDHINQDQLQDENKQEAEGGINPEESPSHL